MSADDHVTGMDRYLLATRLLDYRDPALVELVTDRGWAQLPAFEQIERIYEFVRNEIAFGYNRADDITASQVLADGYGQCNTKGTLFMALLRSCGIPCRFHGFTIDKELQHGAITGIAYRLAPRSIIHSWVEILYDGNWVNLEGFILDQPYLRSIQARFASVDGPFSGYGVATQDLRNPPVEWQGSDTYIQRDGINHDFGVFDAPDDFYQRHGTNLTGIKKLIYSRILRHWVNRNITGLRQHNPSHKP